MHVLLTTCTARKSPSPGTLPAVERYLDPRIDHAVATARARGLPLLVFSGVYGLLAASDPVPLYDHALRPNEVEWAAGRVAAGLRDRAVSRVTAVLERADAPGWSPYHRALADGCAQVGVPLALELWVPARA